MNHYIEVEVYGKAGKAPSGSGFVGPPRITFKAGPLMGPAFFRSIIPWMTASHVKPSLRPTFTFIAS